MNQKKYYPTAVALYITYFILGIAVTIMGQYKQSFAAMWGANQLADGSFDVSKVMAIIAAVGLGRLIAFPFAGPFSDKYGRRLSALVGVVFFAIFFIGITFTQYGFGIYPDDLQRHGKLLFGYKHHALLHGNLQGKRCDCKPVYKIRNFYGTVPAAIFNHLRCSKRYVLPHTVFPGGRHHHRRWYLPCHSALPSQGGGT